MKIAGGVLGWSEDQFWQSSPQFFFAALDGWIEVHGSQQQELSEQDYESFKQEHAAELALTDDDLRRIRENNRKDIS